MRRDVASRTLTKRLMRFGLILSIVAVVGATTLLLTLNTLHISFFSVSGDSMEPELSNRDSIILKQSEDLLRDDLVFFYLPKVWTYEAAVDTFGEQPTIVVKRIVAVPGDTISYDGADFMVNGESVFSFVDSGYLCAREPGYTYELEQGEIIAFGDNPAVSLDSRRVFCDGKKDFIVGQNLILDHGKIALKF